MLRLLQEQWTVGEFRIQTKWAEMLTLIKDIMLKLTHPNFQAMFKYQP